MAVTIDWPTKVITVPQADLTPLGGSLYELDVDTFRLALRAIEAGEEGVAFLHTHERVAPKTIAGVTYAQFFEIINGYTVLFEDLQYTVQVTGANHNISDVKVLNQVSVIIGNSAGLIVTAGGGGGGSDVLEHQGAIYIDTGNGAAGTVVGTNGIPSNPVNSLADAVTLAAATGLREYRIRKTSGGPLTLTSSHDDWKFTGIGGEAEIALNNQDVDGSFFEEVALSGQQNGTVHCHSCELDGVTDLLGYYENTGLANSLALAPGESTFVRPFSLEPGTARPTLDFVGAGRSANIRAYSGGIELVNLVDASNIVTLEFIAGAPTIAASCTAGTIDIRGVGKPIVNNGGGSLVVIDTGYMNVQSFWEWAGGIFTGYSPARVLRTIYAAVAGETTGGPTNQKFERPDNAATQLDMDADLNGDRTKNSEGA